LEVESVPAFSVNMRHAVESCPLFNAEVKNKLKEVSAENWMISPVSVKELRQKLRGQ